ncbi:MAG: carboxypeptidase M32 [Candidatus Thorarchaeota archaeon]
MEQPNQACYHKLVEGWKEAVMLWNLKSILEWDSKSNMPRGGYNQRGEEMASLAATIQRTWMNEETEHMLREAERPENLDTLDQIQRRNLFLIRHEYEKDAKVPEELARKRQKQAAMASNARLKAKKEGTWSPFEDEFKGMFMIEKEIAAYHAESMGLDTLYDALLDRYQRGIRTDDLTALLKELVNSVSPLAKKYAILSKEVETDFMDRSVDIELQKRIVRHLANFVGYDLESESAFGILGESEHPFTMGLYDDVRILVKYEENRFQTSIMSFLHESGHALYNRHLNTEWKYEPVGYHAGSAVTESQARLIENIIGRSLEFWEYFLPILNNMANGLFENISVADFTKAVNPVQLQPLRVYADELTYNMHIAIRFEIERSLFAEEIDASEIPSVWNELYQKYLGVEVKNDGEGALQDPHWAIGMFGHFPTYSLGNVISAQIIEAMEKDFPEWRLKLASGDISKILDWMRGRIYLVGRLYDLPELMNHVTGKGLSAKPYIKYLTHKYSVLYS